MSPHLFIIDDNRIDRMLISRAFDHASGNFTTQEFEDGETVLHALETSEPAGALLDVRMPGMDGFEVLKRIRSSARTAKLPVIMLSSSDERDDLVRAHQCGATAYFTKPDTVGGYRDLVARIHRIWFKAT